MINSIGSAIAAYTSAAQGRPGASANAAKPAGGDFSSLVRDAAQSTVDSLKKGEAATLNALTGKADIAQVVTAVTNAEVTLQATVAVRDRVIQSYLDIIRMPI